MVKTQPRLLRRYTDVLSVLDMVVHRRITLLTPANWSDLNDRNGMQMFAERMQAKEAYAFCMTGAKETSHHWKVFADHGFGACVIFHRTRLLNGLDAYPNILRGPVDYKKHADLAAMAPIPTEKLPFLKREVFEDEREYRLVATAPDFLASGSLTVGIKLDWIARIVFASNIPRPFVETLEGLIRAQEGCAMITLHFSRMPESQTWAAAFAKACASTTVDRVTGVPMIGGEETKFEDLQAIR
jgi:hypothetical protein